VKVFTIQLKNTVIPAWMLEFSHKDVFNRTPSLAFGLTAAMT
jgi:hypothetical protein